MTQYLLDTNILLRANEPNSSSYILAMNSVNTIIGRGEKCVITPQVLIEFWVVATRPLNVNGLGWTTAQTISYVDDLLYSFTLIEETPAIFPLWFQLVTTHNIKGKRTHDIRLLAVMKANNIPNLLTFNPKDFISLNDVNIIHPQDIINSQETGKF